MGTSTARVVVLRGPGELAVETREVPNPGPGEVVVQIDAALVGGAETATWTRGPGLRAPRAVPFGHEAAGVVEAVGSGVVNVREGDRVVPVGIAACGSCAFCRRAAPLFCDRAAPMPGLLAERVLLPAAIVSRSLHVIPEGLESETAALAHDLACVLAGFEATPLGPGRTAVVLGTGAVGLLWVRTLANAGADVIAIDRRSSRLAVAKTLGAAHVVDASRTDDIGHSVRAVTESQLGADLVVECAGTIEAWERAVGMVRRGGTVHLFGLPDRRGMLRVPVERVHGDGVSLIAARGATSARAIQALNLLAAGYVDPNLFLEEDVPSFRVATVLRHIAAGTGPIKAVVRP